VGLTATELDRSCCLCKWTTSIYSNSKSRRLTKEGDLQKLNRCRRRELAEIESGGGGGGGDRRWWGRLRPAVEGAEAVGTGGVGAPSCVVTGEGRGEGDGQ
jgi:hypothetical protein